jgi:hypothetical protein
MQQKQVLKMTEYEIVEDCYTKLLNIDNIKEVHLEIPYMSKVKLAAQENEIAAV